MGPDVENYGGHEPIKIKFPLKEEPVFNCPLQQELTALRAQVEELSKYPEEAVRAACETLLEEFGEMPMEEGEWQAAKRAVKTSFKEKQGEGK